MEWFAANALMLNGAPAPATGWGLSAHNREIAAFNASTETPVKIDSFAQNSLTQGILKSPPRGTRLKNLCLS
jgi:hypothetical protein